MHSLFDQNNMQNIGISKYKRRHNYVLRIVFTKKSLFLYLDNIFQSIQTQFGWVTSTSLIEELLGIQHLAISITQANVSLSQAGMLLKSRIKV